MRVRYLSSKGIRLEDKTIHISITLLSFFLTSTIQVLPLLKTCYALQTNPTACLFHITSPVVEPPIALPGPSYWTSHGVFRSRVGYKPRATSSTAPPDMKIVVKQIPSNIRRRYAQILRTDRRKQLPDQFNST